MKKKYNIFFGAAGAGKAYSKHTSITPDYYIDNDKEKWGLKLNGAEIKSPSFLTIDFINQINQLTITTGYVKSVLPQLLSMGVPRNIIEVPPKSLLGFHPFTSKKNKIQSAKFLDILMNTDHKMHVVAGGGTALGFCRDSDFIKWDFDFDLFASLKYRDELIILLKKLECSNYLENNEIKAELKLSTDEVVPFSIKFFDPEKKFYIDVYEDHVWEWPSEMFSKCANIKIHGFQLKVPNPPEEYLEGVYGKSWNIPNPKFSYDDYGKS